MSIFPQVEAFLGQFCPSSQPILLALSGGSDSLCLFHCLLLYREKRGLPFHIAHVDHGWRKESKEEAEALQRLSEQHGAPFYLKTLNPGELKGNLESSSRNERYAFLAAMCRRSASQGVLTGHHRDDHAETIFKRILEGAHWSRWGGLKRESWVQGARVLRPLLNVSKNEIRQLLLEAHIEPFEDSTNHDLRFLRPRLRHAILPRLSLEFGKRVERSLVEIGREASELADYFESRLAPLLDKLEQGPEGVYLDLRDSLPKSHLEVKYLLRLLSARLGFFLSREIVQSAADALIMNGIRKRFLIGKREIEIDRRHILIRKTGSSGIQY